MLLLTPTPGCTQLDSDVVILPPPLTRLTVPAAHSGGGMDGGGRGGPARCACGADGRGGDWGGRGEVCTFFSACFGFGSGAVLKGFELIGSPSSHGVTTADPVGANSALHHFQILTCMILCWPRFVLLLSYFLLPSSVTLHTSQHTAPQPQRSSVQPAGVGRVAASRPSGSWQRRTGHSRAGQHGQRMSCRTGTVRTQAAAPGRPGAGAGCSAAASGGWQYPSQEHLGAAPGGSCQRCGSRGGAPPRAAQPPAGLCRTGRQAAPAAAQAQRRRRWGDRHRGGRQRRRRWGMGQLEAASAGAGSCSHDAVPRTGHAGSSCGGCGCGCAAAERAGVGGRQGRRPRGDAPSGRAALAPGGRGRARLARHDCWLSLLALALLASAGCGAAVTGLFSP